MTPHHLNVFPDLVLLVVSFCTVTVITYWILKNPAWRTPLRRLCVAAAYLLITGIQVFAYLLSFHRTWRHAPALLATWMQASGLISDVVIVGLFLALLFWQRMPEYRSGRRQFLQAAGATLAIAPVVGTTLGIIGRNQFRLSEIKIPIPNLPKDLNGLKMVQITDIHLSPFLSAGQFARAIDMANETKAHLVLVTGDLITRMGDPLDACLAQLARLRGEAGMLGCMGNHEVYTGTEDYVHEQGRRIGIDFLRGERRSLRFGSATINFAGVDYQNFHHPYLVGAESLVVPDQLNILLSHNPDVFPKAARMGFDLTIAGHTHGGQVNFEILHRNVNVALAFTPFVRGLYQRGKASVYVSSGIGTIGVPVRVGAPAEVSLIELCAS